MEDLKEIIKGAAILFVILFAVFAVFAYESDADQADRRSKECAEQGYNGIEKAYTSTGDVYFVCANK